MAFWTDVEDNALRTYYSVKPRRWPGWEEVLPGRSESARRNRASKLGIIIDANVPRGEAQVCALMESGFAPSEIDRRMGVTLGTTRKAIVSRWARDKAMAAYA